MEDTTTIQTLLFPVTKWTVREAKSWLRWHGFKSSKVDETRDFLRFRQLPPERFVAGSFRTIPMGKRTGDPIKAVIGHLR